MNPGALAHYQRKMRLQNWRERIEQTYQEQAQQNGLHAIENGLYGEEYFVDEDGYDVEGYDEDGYDRHGLDENGYNRQGKYIGRDLWDFDNLIW